MTISAANTTICTRKVASKSMLTPPPPEARATVSAEGSSNASDPFGGGVAKVEMPEQECGPSPQHERRAATRKGWAGAYHRGETESSTTVRAPLSDGN